MSQLSLKFGRSDDLLGVAELYATANQDLLQRLPEDRRLEFKSARYQLNQLSEYFSMWANTPPDGGLIAVGVEGNKNFVGCRALGPDRVNRLEVCGHTYCADATYESRRVPIVTPKHETDFVLLFKVDYNPTRVVFTTKHKAFIRRGESKHRLSPDEIRLTKQDKGEINFEQEPCNLTYPDDFDMTAVRSFVDLIRSERDFTYDHSDSDILDLQHLGEIKQEQFVPNYACALLFAKDPSRLLPGCQIHFLRFEGEVEGSGSKWNAVKDEMIQGQVPYLIAEAEKLLGSQLRTFSRYEQGKFFTSPEYPHAAWYEAIVNACVHRSYTNGLQNMDISVRMFDDRLEIESPGPFPPFVTPQNIYTQHHPRNPKLMYAMRFLRFVRCAREGTRRMRDTMLALDLPEPEFAQEEVGHSIVKVTLRNNVKQRKVWIDADVAGLVGAAIAKTLTEDEKRAVNHAAEYGEVGVSDLQRLTGRSWPSAKKILDQLTSKGIFAHIKRADVDRDPRARYILRAVSDSGDP